jgi:hypothetical protein
MLQNQCVVWQPKTRRYVFSRGCITRSLRGIKIWICIEVSICLHGYSHLRTKFAKLKVIKYPKRLCNASIRFVFVVEIWKYLAASIKSWSSGKKQSRVSVLWHGLHRNDTNSSLPLVRLYRVVSSDIGNTDTRAQQNFHYYFYSLPRERVYWAVA